MMLLHLICVSTYIFLLFEGRPFFKVYPDFKGQNMPANHLRGFFIDSAFFAFFQNNIIYGGAKVHSVANSRVSES